MYKELLIQCEKLGIDIEKASVALIVDETIGRNSKNFEKVCEMTFNQFSIADIKFENNEKQIIC